ncbi:TIGR03564 family F420-dependent LLM class oxidoreductase [Actinomadura viridis]|uniref:F420-dependent oxidoreductase-like protein n=1 Tax=Actinomadura viridis TaxID=58110 RepID=A0A931DDM2_9ACTN|nr:LLM class F420-dependent oxidoreductase [Actinomadura viridis]MBG6088180.1 F420-dependent oxidoreductase-like protein [Actinomadura viridis]
MRIGQCVVGAGSTLEEIVGEVRAAAAAGLDGAFLPQLAGWDAIMAAGAAGREVPGIEVGTAVVPTYPRHPVTMAEQALTAQAVSGGRFTLGIGPSHSQIIEGSFGIPYTRPAAHTREYLSVLRPLLRGEEVDHRGEALTAAGRVAVPGIAPPPVLLSALGPRMLRIAGELADGTVTTWLGPEGIAGHIVPLITRAAEEAGRPAPRIVAGAVVALTHDPEAARREVLERFGIAGDLPSYRAVLDRQGLSNVHETIVAGDERAVTAEVRRFAEAGATDLLVTPLGDADVRARTIELLGSLSGTV